MERYKPLYEVDYDSLDKDWQKQKKQIAKDKEKKDKDKPKKKKLTKDWSKVKHPWE